MLNMEKHTFSAKMTYINSITAITMFAVLVLPANVHAQKRYALTAFAGAEQTETKTESTPPISETILKILKPEEAFKTLQNYIKLPLPGTGVKKVEVDKENVSKLNTQITKETGVDVLKFFQFIGKVLIIILEGATRLIRGLLQGV